MDHQPENLEPTTGLLDQLEADLVAVETALATLDAIASEGTGGTHAATEIRAAVSPERFAITEG